MNKTINNNKQLLITGFTLVEVIIAIAVGMTLVAIIIQIFVSNKASYNTINGLSQIQENARIGVIFLSREARKIGYQGCAKNTSIINNVDINGNGSADDISTIYDENNRLLVSDNISSLSIGGFSVLAGSDTIRFQYAESCGGQLIDNMSSELDNITISDENKCNLATNNLFLISDCQFRDIVAVASISNNPPKTSINHATKNTSTELSKRYLDNAEVLLLRSYQYFIANNSDGIASLMRFDNVSSSTVELINGVENMQLLLGEDTDGNGTANRYVIAGTAGLDMSRVVSLQLSLLIATTDQIASKIQPTMSYPPPPFNSGSGGTYTPTDRKLYKVFNMNIALRNQLN